jgi:hypothetical protein
VPFLIEMANAPTRQQEQILWALLDALKEGFPGRWSFAGVPLVRPDLDGVHRRPLRPG